MGHAPQSVPTPALRHYSPSMGILIPFVTLVIAWILTLLDVAAPGGAPDEATMVSAMRWLLFIPGGFMFLASGVMHTVFLQRAAARGATTLQGLGMLVNQALTNARLWTGQDLDADVMRRALEESLAP